MAGPNQSGVKCWVVSPCSEAQAGLCVGGVGVPATSPGSGTSCRVSSQDRTNGPGALRVERGGHGARRGRPSQGWGLTHSLRAHGGLRAQRGQRRESCAANFRARRTPHSNTRRAPDPSPQHPPRPRHRWRAVGVPQPALPHFPLGHQASGLTSKMLIPRPPLGGSLGAGPFLHPMKAPGTAGTGLASPGAGTVTREAEGSGPQASGPESVTWGLCPTRCEQRGTVAPISAQALRGEVGSRHSFCPGLSGNPTPGLGPALARSAFPCHGRCPGALSGVGPPWPLRDERRWAAWG